MVSIISHKHIGWSAFSPNTMGAIKSAQTNLRTDLCWLCLQNNQQQIELLQSSANTINQTRNRKANP
jgi:hypothetical protein